jgi:hypothetical protein
MNEFALVADMLLVVHIAYMAYVVVGQLAILIGWPLGWRWIRNPWFRVTHLAAIMIVVVETLFGWRCPLTDWEEELRVLAGQRVAGQESLGFIAEWLHYFFLFPPSWQGFLNTCFLLAGAVILATVILVPPRFRETPAPGTAIAT